MCDTRCNQVARDRRVADRSRQRGDQRLPRGRLLARDLANCLARREFFRVGIRLPRRYFHSQLWLWWPLSDSNRHDLAIEGF